MAQSCVVPTTGRQRRTVNHSRGKSPPVINVNFKAPASHNLYFFLQAGSRIHYVTFIIRRSLVAATHRRSTTFLTCHFVHFNTDVIILGL